MLLVNGFGLRCLLTLIVHCLLLQVADEHSHNQHATAEQGSYRTMREDRRRAVRDVISGYTRSKLGGAKIRKENALKYRQAHKLGDLICPAADWKLTSLSSPARTCPCTQ